MDKPSATDKRDRLLAAAIAASGIVVGFLVYWTIQVQAVRELLAMAYG